MTWLTIAVLQSGIVPRGTRVEVFQRIYDAFLILGTLVGIVVIAYMVWKAYKYRDGADRDDVDVDRPELGEIPTGGGGGRKLFLSFGLSTIIVVSLIVWTYGTLLYVESPGGEDEDELTVEVVGHQFYWEFIYPNGHTTQNTLRVPEDERVRLKVTSGDVFHNFGIPELRVKSDAIPGQYTDSWFIANETGEYAAHCYELCGTGHSYMDATVQVMPQDEYESWYQQTTPAPTATPGNETATSTEGGH